jgi:hypothetical protein
MAYRRSSLNHPMIGPCRTASWLAKSEYQRGLRRAMRELPRCLMAFYPGMWPKGRGTPEPELGAQR